MKELLEDLIRQTNLSESEFDKENITIENLLKWMIMFDIKEINGVNSKCKIKIEL
jgi:hypothetical protein